MGRWVIAAAVVTSAGLLCGGGLATTSAKKLLLRATFSGAYKGRVNWVHVQNGFTYGCVQWTRPESRSVT